MKQLSEKRREHLQVIYHIIVVVVSAFMCFACGVVSYHGTPDETINWFLAVLPGVFGLALWVYFYTGAAWLVKKVMARVAQTKSS